jgi:acyl carrier protein
MKPDALMDEHLQDVLRDVSRMIREVIGEEWAEDVPIGMDTSFSRDLELESIEFVALAERLRGAYGAGVDFAGWLATMELKDILALDVGQLVEFIARCTSKHATA